jgi:large subunit ribosomal protein L21e
LGRSKGYRRRTRALLKKRYNVGGLSRILRDYSVGEKVVIKIDSTQVKGMPHRRFNGLVGVVTEITGRALIIDVPVGDKMKTVISRKDHIAPLKGAENITPTPKGDKDQTAPAEES